MLPSHTQNTFNVTWDEIVNNFDPTKVNDIVDRKFIDSLIHKIQNCRYWAIPHHLNDNNTIPASSVHAGAPDLFSNRHTKEVSTQLLLNAMLSSVTIDTDKWSRRNAAILAKLRLFKGLGRLLNSSTARYNIETGRYHAFYGIPAYDESVVRWYKGGYAYNLDRRVCLHPFDSYYVLFNLEIARQLARRVKICSNSNFKGEIKPFKSDALICFYLEHKHYGFALNDLEEATSVYKTYFSGSTPDNLKKEQLNFHLKTYTIRSVCNGLIEARIKNGVQTDHRYSITTYTRNSKVV